MANVLVVGSGGREHALGWKLSQSPGVERVYYAPGNAGTQEGKGKNVPLSVEKKDQFPHLDLFLKEFNIGLTVIGPEAPLNNGVVDYLESNGHRVFGPSAVATALEADKFFSWDVMNLIGIPQAQSIKCFTPDQAARAIRDLTNQHGVVIKARGLTGGKGVTVCDSQTQALEEIANHMQAYGPDVLIAERLVGEEFSVFGISDGNRVSPLEMAAQDHKRLLDNDKGVNTGGMGAYAPAPIASAKAIRSIADTILTPVVQQMKENGMEYKGFIYAGMMMTAQGPKVIEFNARFGDPECQPLMMMMKTDLYVAINAALDGNAPAFEFKDGAACCVVLASKGYPGAYTKGLPVTGLDDVADMQDVKVFHAGTAMKEGKIVTSGGRVLGVTAYSPDGLRDAQGLAYRAVGKLHVPGGFHNRADIADKGLRR